MVRQLAHVHDAQAIARVHHVAHRQLRGRRQQQRQDQLCPASACPRRFRRARRRCAAGCLLCGARRAGRRWRRRWRVRGLIGPDAAVASLGGAHLKRTGRPPRVDHNGAELGPARSRGLGPAVACGGRSRRSARGPVRAVSSRARGRGRHRALGRRRRLPGALACRPHRPCARPHLCRLPSPGLYRPPCRARQRRRAWCGALRSNLLSAIAAHASRALHTTTLIASCGPASGGIIRSHTSRRSVSRASTAPPRRPRWLAPPSRTCEMFVRAQCVRPTASRVSFVYIGMCSEADGLEAYLYNEPSPSINCDCSGCPNREGCRP